MGVRVLDPGTGAGDRTRQRSVASLEGEKPISDPALAGWLFGPDWATKQGPWASRFRIVHPEPSPSRAWFVPLTALARPAMLDSWSGEVGPLLDLFDRARPLAAECAIPGAT